MKSDEEAEREAWHVAYDNSEGLGWSRKSFGIGFRAGLAHARDCFKGYNAECHVEALPDNDRLRERIAALERVAEKARPYAEGGGQLYDALDALDRAKPEGGKDE